MVKRKRRNPGGGQRGNKNRLRKLKGFDGYDLGTVEGLRGVIQEATRQHLANRISYRQLSAVTSAVQLLLDELPEKPVPARQIANTLAKSSPDTSGTNAPSIENEDPVPWIEANLAWKPFSYQADLLRDYWIKTRIIRKSRQVGITSAVAMEAIWKAYTTAGRTILLVSPSDRQSKIMMDRIQAAVDSNRSLGERVTRKNTSGLWLDNGSAILSLPNNPDRIRGFSATDIYLDEAAHFLNDGPVMAVVKPMLVATKGSFTIVSTPFGKRGLFWEQYKVASNEQGRRSDVKAYDLYPSTISPLISSEQLEDERLNLTELEFKQEYEGEFIEQVDTYLPLDLIMGCVDPALVLQDAGTPGTQYIMGVDFAKQRDETVVMLLDRDSAGSLTVRHISAWSSMDYTEQIGRITLLSKTFKTISGAADKTGVGEAVMEELRKIVPQVQGITFTMESKVQLASTLRSLLEQKKLRLPNDKRLIMQLNGLTYNVSKTGNLLFESPEKTRLHDDYLWALALACYAARQPHMDLSALGSWQIGEP